MSLSSPKRRGFTLIEVMIVITIVGIVLSAGIPMMWKAMAKDPLSKAVNDIIEGCKTARDRAILRNRPYDFVMRKKSENGPRELTIEETKIKDPSGLSFPGSDQPIRDPGSLTGDFPRAMGEEVVIQLVDVNFVDHLEATEVRVRFSQNGTSDEFTIVMEHKGKQRHVKVDIITGTAFEVVK